MLMGREVSIAARISATKSETRLRKELSKVDNTAVES